MSKNHMDIDDEFMKKTADILAGLPDMPLPEGFDERLHKALLEESKQMEENNAPIYNKKRGISGIKLRNINWKRMSGVAAVFLFLIAGAGMYSQGVFDQFLNAPMSDEMALAGGQDGYQTMINSELSDEADSDEYTLVYGEGCEEFFASEENKQKWADLQVGGSSQVAPTKKAAPETGSELNLMMKQPDTSDRGMSLQREGITDPAVKALYSKYKQMVESFIEGLYQEAFDSNTLKYSVMDYVKVDDKTEVFMYNIEGIRNGQVMHESIAISANDSGCNVMAEPHISESAGNEEIIE